MACLRWSLDNPDAGELRAAYRHYGADIPKGLVAPELHDVEYSYWEAFWNLSSERRAGRPIPWLSIRQYFRVDGFGDFHSFQSIIKAMDGIYIKAIESRK